MSDWIRDGTHKHFFVLANSNTFPLDYLQVLQATQDLMLDFEYSLHPELGGFLDREGLVLETLQGAGGGEIDCDIRTAFHLESKRLDDAFAGIVHVG